MNPDESEELAEVFRAEAREILEGLGKALLALEREGPGGESQTEAFRLFHTLKGMANMAGLEEVGLVCHDAEASLAAGSEPRVDELFRALDQVSRLLAVSPARGAPEAEARAQGPDNRFISVDIRRMDTLMNLVGELTVAETRLAYEHRHREGGVSEETLARVSHLVRVVQQEVMRAGLLPIRNLFATLPRLARDTAKEEGKLVHLQLDEGNLELDRSMADRMGGVLAHLVQNAIVHGVETPSEREAAGKPSAGTVVVRCRREHEMLVVEVEDDGGGVDFDRARERAVDTGAITAEAAAALSDNALLDLLMQPGFSTARRTSRHAGRGIGLTAVQEAVRHLGGEVKVASRRGAGTRITVRLPPTVAVVDTLLAETREATIALPLRNVNRILPAGAATRAAGALAVPFDGLAVPVFQVDGTLAQESGEGFVVVGEALGGRFGLAVDRVLGTHSSILKPVDGSLMRGVSALGATILGSGGLALVLDPNSFEGVIPS